MYNYIYKIIILKNNYILLLFPKFFGIILMRANFNLVSIHSRWIINSYVRYSTFLLSIGGIMSRSSTAEVKSNL